MTRPTVRWAILAVCLSPLGCHDNGGRAAAREAFDAFQTALLAQDVESVRWLLTRNSWPILEHLPWDRIADQQPVECLSVEQRNGRFELQVRDPNENDTISTYVVARENGRYRVDLLQTTLFNHTAVALPGPATRVVPRQLTADEIDEIATREAAHIR